VLKPFVKTSSPHISAASAQEATCDTMTSGPPAKRCKVTVIPTIGFGTYKLGESDTEKCVLAALRSGYRHIDTAQVYGNEKAVGRAIKNSNLPRESISVTSKVWRTKHGYERARASVLQSLKVLDLEYVDMMLVHYPGPKTGWPLRRGDQNPSDWTPQMREETWPRGARRRGTEPKTRVCRTLHAGHRCSTNP